MKIRGFENVVRGLFVFSLLLSIQVHGQTKWSGVWGNEWIVNGQPYHKIIVKKEGIQSIAINTLPAIFQVSENIPKIQLWHRGKQVALIKPESGIGGDVSQILFYGVLNDGDSDKWLYRPATTARTNTLVSMYSDDGYYFLTIGNDTKDRAPKITSASVTPAPLDADAQVSHSFKQYNVLKTRGTHDPNDAGRRPTYLNSFFETGRSRTGQRLSLMGFLENSATNPNPDNGVRYVNTEKDANGRFEFEVKNLASGQPVMEVLLTGRSEESRAIDVYIVNQAGDIIRTIAPTGSGTRTSPTFTGFTSNLVTFPLQTGDYDATTGKGYLGFRNFSSYNFDLFSISYYNVTYRQTFSMGGDLSHKFMLDAAATTSSKVKVGGLPSGTIKIYDITDIYNVKVIEGDAGDFNIPRTIGDPLNLLITSETNTPEMETPTLAMGNISKAPDYLIISSGTLLAASQSYGDFRATTRNVSKGTFYSPFTIAIKDVYNHFNYGEPSPVAIKRFVDYMLSGTDKDKYLLLIGKSISREFDMKRELPDDVPTIGYPGSDELLVDGIGGAAVDIPAIPVGRIPALTTAHVDQYRAKAMKYELGGPSEDFTWRNKVIHVSGGNSVSQQSTFRTFMSNLTVPAPGSVSEYYKTNGTANIEDLTITQLKTPNPGVGMITFFGHGTTYQTDKNVGYVTDSDKGYEDSQKYAGLFFFGCDVNNVFHNRFGTTKPYSGASMPIGMDWLLAENKGSITSFGNSWDGYEAAFDPYMIMLYEKLFVADSQKKPIGKILKEISTTIVEDPQRESKYGGYLSANYLMYQANIHQGVLLGDPAVRLLYLKSTALPVGLNSFKGERKEDGVQLTWKTAWEKDNGYFEVQRSGDAKNFETIGVIDGNGSTDSESSYAYLDINPLLGIGYYRLLQVDAAGADEPKKSYSRIIQVRGVDGDQAMVIAPNPVLFQFEIKTMIAGFEPKSYRITNASGQVVKAGERNSIVDMSSFKPGIYLLEVMTEQGVITKKIVKY